MYYKIDFIMKPFTNECTKIHNLYTKILKGNNYDPQAFYDIVYNLNFKSENCTLSEIKIIKNLLDTSGYYVSILKSNNLEYDLIINIKKLHLVKIDKDVKSTNDR